MSILHSWRELFRLVRVGVIQLFFPPVCLLCGRKEQPLSSEFLCFACQMGLEEEIKAAQHIRQCSICGRFVTSLPAGWGKDSFSCEECREHRPPFVRVKAAGLYQGVLRQALLQFKFANNPQLAQSLARLLTAVIEQERLKARWPYQADIVVAIPLTLQRQRERGYNQSLLLARRVAEHLGLPLDSGALQRKIATPPQSTLRRRERMTAVHGVFSAGRQVAGRRVLVIDDVLTTGSTMAEAARTLLRAGALEVTGLVMAAGAVRAKKNFY